MRMTAVILERHERECQKMVLPRQRLHRSSRHRHGHSMCIGDKLAWPHRILLVVLENQLVTAVGYGSMV
jgi:hypothetical protein